MDAESALQALFSRVSDWSSKAADGQTLVLDFPERIETYIVHSELRKRIPSIWTVQNEGHVSVNMSYFKKNDVYKYLLTTKAEILWMMSRGDRFSDGL